MKALSTTQALSTITCPLSGKSYAMAISGTSGKLHLTTLHPLLTSQLAPSQALKLGTEWLLWLALHKISQLGGLSYTTPILASSFGHSLHKAVELAQELACIPKWRSSYPAYRYTADSTPDNLLDWMEGVWQSYTGSGSLSYATQEERSASSSLDSALRVQAARKQASSLKSTLQAVADTMLDLHSTGWKERHSEWLTSCATKAAPALSVLTLLREKLTTGYPDTHFVGVQATQQLGQTIQHLDALRLQQAQELAQFAMSEEDEQQAASTIAGIQAQYAGLGLTSKIGYVVVPASSKVGDKNADGKMAKAIAARLQAALEQSSSIQAASTEPAPKLLPVDTSSHAVDCPCIFCKPLIGAPYNPAAQPAQPAQPAELTPMQRAIAARAAQGAAK